MSRLLFVLLIIITCTTASIRITDRSIVDDILEFNPLTIKYSTRSCPVPIIGQKCPSGNEFYYFECCGELNKDCCGRIQDWVTLVMALLTALIFFLIIFPCLVCMGCIKRRE